MNPQPKSPNKDTPHISPVQYIAINRTPQAKKFVVNFGKTPATSMADLQMKMATIVKQFGDEAKKELAKLHPDTKWILKAMAASKMEGGQEGEYESAHGKGCQCPKCKGLENHSNFVTNYRSDVDSPLNNNVMELSSAEGGKLAARGKNSLAPVAVVLAIIALGVLTIASGEQHRSYQ